MYKVWFFLTIVLDVFPYILLQYLPFKDTLKYGYSKTIGLALAVMLIWFIPFPFLMEQPWFSLDFMVVYRVSLLFPLLCLAIYFIRGNIFQNIFVFALMLPYVMFVLVASSFLVGHMPLPDAPLYMISAIGRVIIVTITFPIALLTFKRFLIPAMNLHDGGIWKYAWLIPAFYNLISMFFVQNDYEVNGVTVSQLLGHLSIMICCILTCLLVAAALKRTQERAELLERERHNDLLLDLQAQQYKSISKNIEETARSRHDLRHQFLLIESFVAKNDIDGLKTFLSEISNTLPLDGPTTTFCDNHAINAILGYYMSKAENEQIKINSDLRLGDVSNISDSDLCVLFGNLIENAIEACKTVTENRYILLKSDVIAGRFSIVIENNFDGVYKTKNGHHLSRKRSYGKEGIGLTTVIAIVDKYNGNLRIQQNENIFTISLYLQL